MKSWLAMASVVGFGLWYLTGAGLQGWKYGLGFIIVIVAGLAVFGMIEIADAREKKEVK